MPTIAVHIAANRRILLSVTFSHHQRAPLMGITISHRVRRDIREAARKNARRFLMKQDATVAKAGRRQTLTITNMNYELRERLLKPYYEKEKIGGLRCFTCLPLNVLEELISHNFVEMEEWNCCDGVAKLFLPFLRRHPQFSAHGYAVLEGREDTRITIEGVECSALLTIDEIIDFARTFRGADDMALYDDYADCWYD
jgi:hypothetical protein